MNINVKNPKRQRAHRKTHDTDSRKASMYTSIQEM